MPALNVSPSWRSAPGPRHDQELVSNQQTLHIYGKPFFIQYAFLLALHG